MNEISPETEPESESSREITLTGSAIEGTLEQVQKDAPGYRLEGKSLNELEEDAIIFALRAAQPLPRAERDQLTRSAKAVQRLMTFCRSNNSITGITKDETGRSVGLTVQVKQFPESQSG